MLASKATVISLQNGVGNAAVLQQAMPRNTVLPGMIAFNVVQGEKGCFHAGTDGEVIIQDAPVARELAGFLKRVARPLKPTMICCRCSGLSCY